MVFFFTAIYLNKDKAKLMQTKRFWEGVTLGRLNVYCKIKSDISLPDFWDRKNTHKPYFLPPARNSTWRKQSQESAYLDDTIF